VWSRLDITFCVKLPLFANLIGKAKAVLRSTLREVSDFEPTAVLSLLVH